MVRSYRSDWKIIMDILKSGLSEGARKTHIMYRANLNYVSFNKYFPALLGEGLLVKVDNSDGGVLYRTSEKGKALFKLLSAVDKSLPRKGVLLNLAYGQLLEFLVDSYAQFQFVVCEVADNRVLGGWANKFQKQWKEYERKEEGTKYPPHRLDWRKRLEWVNPSVKTLVAQLISEVQKEFPEAEHLPKYRWYYFYKGKSRDMDSLFAVLMLKKKEIKVRIRTDPTKFKDTKNWTKVYKGWFFKKGEEREFSLIGTHQLDYAMELIRQSYETSGEIRYFKVI